MNGKARASLGSSKINRAGRGALSASHRVPRRQVRAQRKTEDCQRKGKAAEARGELLRRWNVPSAEACVLKLRKLPHWRPYSGLRLRPEAPARIQRPQSTVWQEAGQGTFFDDFSRFFAVSSSSVQIWEYAAGLSITLLILAMISASVNPGVTRSFCQSASVRNLPQAVSWPAASG